mmetsp:Transcript_30685/g.49944  ORF Transcript_30685/g.49944 Transcript_30685/m.49944 type:complete len:138 (+) Transcript_30685:350-763(+)
MKRQLELEQQKSAELQQRLDLKVDLGSREWHKNKELEHKNKELERRLYCEQQQIKLLEQRLDLELQNVTNLDVYGRQKREQLERMELKIEELERQLAESQNWSVAIAMPSAEDCQACAARLGTAATGARQPPSPGHG